MKLSTGIIAENETDENSTPRIFIEISDFGKVFSATDTSTDNGRGIDNMQYRAQQVNAKLKI